MDILAGRKIFIDVLVGLMLKKQVIMLYGPVGIGKTSILEMIRLAIEKKGIPWGLAKETRSLSDLTKALQGAYPGLRDKEMSQRHIRSELRAAARNNPGVLFLDHIHKPGTQFKGFLHYLHYAGMGVLIAADAEGPGDHARLRSMRIEWREMAVRPLANRYMYRILDNSLSVRTLPHSMKDTDRAALLKMAQGRPGWIRIIGKLLQKKEFWSDGNVLLAYMRISIMTEIATIYFVNAE